MSLDLVKAMNDLYGNVSFSSGGGGGGGGGGVTAAQVCNLSNVSIAAGTAVAIAPAPPPVKAAGAAVAIAGYVVGGVACTMAETSRAISR